MIIDELEIDGKWYMLWRNLDYWIWAARKSADELRAAAARESQLSTREAMFLPDSSSRRDLASRELQFYAHSFVVSLPHLLVAAAAVSPHHAPVREALDQASHMMKEAVNLRNMYEHQEEYLGGKGRKQNDFDRREEVVLGGENAMSEASATSFMIADGQHILGHHLHVERALAEVNAIADALATFDFMAMSEAEKRMMKGRG